MSSITLQMKGLDELRVALQRLPEDLAEQAGDIVIANADGCEHEIEAGYPMGPTGNLKAGMTVEHNRSKFGTGAIVRSRAKHAWIFENGTATRQNSRGANRGRMPKAKTEQQMIPKVVKWRAKMTDELKDLVREAGFEVEG